MASVTIEINFPGDVDYSNLPSISGNSLSGMPNVGDQLLYENGKQFVVESRLWAITSEKTTLHIQLIHA